MILDSYDVDPEERKRILDTVDEIAHEAGGFEDLILEAKAFTLLVAKLLRMEDAHEGDYLGILLSELIDDILEDTNRTVTQLRGST